MENAMKIKVAFAVLAALLLISSGSFANSIPIGIGKPPQVEIFTTSWCPYCVKAVKFLRDNNISFVEYDIEKDERAARRLQQLAGRGGVPFAIIDGKSISGWSEQAYKQALGLD
jgi:glutaredoxin